MKDTFREETLRSARTTNDVTISHIISKVYINQMMKQGGKINRFSTTLDKLFGRQYDVIHKYNNISLEFAESLLN